VSLLKKVLKFLGEYSLSIVILIAGIVLFIMFFYYDYRIYGSPFFLRLRELLPLSYYLLVCALVLLFFSLVYLSIMAVKRRIRILDELGKLKTIDRRTKEILKIEGFDKKLKIFGDGLVECLRIPTIGIFVNAPDGFSEEYVSDKSRDFRDYLFNSITKKTIDTTVETFKVFDADCNVVISGKLNKRVLDDLREYFEFGLPVLSSARIEISVDNKRIKTEETLKKYRVLNNLIVDSKASWTYEDISWKAVRVASEIYKFVTTSIIDVSGPQSQWSFISIQSVPNEKIKVVREKIQSPEFGDNLKLIKENKSVLHINNTANYPGWIQIDEHPFSYIGIPILYENEVIAILNVDGFKPYQFDEQDLAFADALSRTLSEIYEKNMKLEEYNKSSITDSLTGLYNRREFDNRIKVETERANRYSRFLSIMELDLDNFKEWNDTYGHLEGDRLLKEFSAIMLNSIRGTDVAFRIGGDEFMILLIETDVKQTRTIATRISKAVKEKNFDDNVRVTVSVGVAEYRSESVQEFQRRVDKALYRAKSFSSGRVFTAK
jgi:diguanylate cyclase (GGDEF)-like protein